MSVRNVVAAVIVLVATLLLLTTTQSARAQQQRPELPQDVKDWMARNQVQRWAQMLQTGEKLFAEGSCVNCHGEGGSGGRWAPDLTDSEWVQSDGDLEGIRETIMWGVRRRDFVDPNRRFQMNPSGGMDLAWEDFDAIAAYVWSLSNGTFLPER